MRLPCCVVCGEPIGGESTAWCHSRCVRGEGWDITGPLESWPEWARDMWRLEKRQRRMETRRIARGIEVVTVSDLSGNEEDGRHIW